jgi:DNA-binding transcriptional MerR regulator
MVEKQYTIEDLCRLTGYSRRTIRYYVQEGILDPPAGRGRGGFYFDSQLDKLRQIRTLQEGGLKLSQIHVLLSRGEQPEPSPLRETWARYSVCEGVEMHVRRDAEEREGKALSEVVRVARSILKGGSKGE